MVIGAIMRGGSWLEGVVRTYITKDGTDATERLTEMVNGSRHYGQIRVIMLNGITFGGFNVIDIEELYRNTGIPVIVVMRKVPDMERIKDALYHLREPERRYGLILKAGDILEVRTSARGKPIYIQYRGLTREDAISIVKASAVHSRIPEPVRTAHIIATGVVLGESSKRV